MTFMLLALHVKDSQANWICVDEGTDVESLRETMKAELADDAGQKNWEYRIVQILETAGV